MKGKLLAIAFSVALSLALLEAGLAVCTRLGLFPIKVPIYSLAQARNTIFWRDVNPDFGVPLRKLSAPVHVVAARGPNSRQSLMTSGNAEYHAWPSTSMTSYSASLCSSAFVTRS